MRYRPQMAGDRAGLVAFQNESHFFFLGVGFANGERVIQLERRAGDALPTDRPIIASAPWPEGKGETIYLRIDANGGSYDFSYGFAPDESIVLQADVDGSVLSTRMAGGFVGTMIGPYAYSPDQ